MLHQQLVQKGGPGTQLKRVDFFTDIKSAPSGGTLETAIGIMFGAEGKAKPHPAIKAVGFDPLLKARDGSKSTSQTAAKNVNLLALGVAKLSQLSKQVGEKVGAPQASMKRETTTHPLQKKRASRRSRCQTRHPLCWINHLSMPFSSAPSRWPPSPSARAFSWPA